LKPHRTPSARSPGPSIPTSELLLRSRLVLPVSRPPVPDGAVLVRGNRIAAVGRWRDLAPASRARLVDLGEKVLLPGLVNAHCHLDYTHMAGQFAYVQSFTEWLQLITSTKAGWELADYLASWRCGAEMLLRTGTTTVGDVEAVPHLLPQAWHTTPLRVLSFLEMIGLTARRPPQRVLREALDKIDSVAAPLLGLGLSPHAPYSTVPELLRQIVAVARKRRFPLTIHLAESAAEFEMFTHGRGEMFDWLQRSGRDMSDCGAGSPVQYLRRCGMLGENLLAVHVNYLARGDAALLGQNRVSVVHCPRSHYYFGHEPFPLRRLARAGVNLCLGTDSLSTVVQRRHQPLELSMFEEFRALAKAMPSLSPRLILNMATLNGARALGQSGRLGELSPGALADLIAVPYAGANSGVYDALVSHKGKVADCLLDGRWVSG
jgi:aminodeoxyfutalosine deaminase